jgi:hypothetical protein
MNDGIGPGGVTSDDIRWEKEATDAQHESLAKVRATAAAWSSSIAALLGVFTVVAFIKGPEGVSSLDQGAGIAVTVLVLVAALLAVGATLTGAFAAQGTPRWLKRLDGPVLRAANRDAVKGVIALLWVSRILALLAALCVLAGMSTAWLSTLNPPASPQHVLVVTRNGAVSCGVLQSGDSHPTELSLGGDGPAVPLVGIVQVVAVEKCP